ncbi:hypothetical protein [Brevibacillus laterosporus]|uniref:Uncharacterized protein n=1 Tax=Brevibacillus laterosporus TaxID=1465 RepID=A0AAP8U6U6_BRELA|nr:hypothetical protein [Brevibacillus laterosporus]PPB10887.1 hypothetical protein C4A77_04485 [Brevibacillus laterosporus]
MENRQSEETVLELIGITGLWDVTNVRIRYLADDWVQFRCEKRSVNIPIKILNVRRSLLDRIIGRSFDEKVKSELIHFTGKLRQQNEKILRLRKKEKELRLFLKDMLLQYVGEKQ